MDVVMRHRTLALCLVVALGCNACSSMAGRSLRACTASVPDGYSAVSLSDVDHAALVSSIEDYYRRQNPNSEPKQTMGRYEYWLFEHEVGDDIICQYARRKSERGNCTPHLWKLGNRDRKLELPAIESICVMS